MGNFNKSRNYATSLGSTSVDPKLLAILQTAASLSPYNVVATSGVRAYNPKTGTVNHPGGWATDIRLIDPATGKAIGGSSGNYQNAKTFAIYEKFAQTARIVQQQMYPELNNTFRWGGYFGAKTGPHGYGAVDLMHFDVNPKLRGATGLGTWEKGASETLLKAYPGAQTNGGLNANPEMVAQVKQGLAGGPAPDKEPGVGSTGDAPRDSALTDPYLSPAELGSPPKPSPAAQWAKPYLDANQPPPLPSSPPWAQPYTAANIPAGGAGQPRTPTIITPDAAAKFYQGFPYAPASGSAPAAPAAVDRAAQIRAQLDAMPDPGAAVADRADQIRATLDAADGAHIGENTSATDWMKDFRLPPETPAAPPTSVANLGPATGLTVPSLPPAIPATGLTFPTAPPRIAATGNTIASLPPYIAATGLTLSSPASSGFGDRPTFVAPNSPGRPVPPELRTALANLPNTDPAAAADAFYRPFDLAGGNGGPPPMPPPLNLPPPVAATGVTQPSPLAPPPFAGRPDYPAPNTFLPPSAPPPISGGGNSSVQPWRAPPPSLPSPSLSAADSLAFDPTSAFPPPDAYAGITSTKAGAANPLLVPQNWSMAYADRLTGEMSGLPSLPSLPPAVPPAGAATGLTIPSAPPPQAATGNVVPSPVNSGFGARPGVVAPNTFNAPPAIPPPLNVAPPTPMDRLHLTPTEMVQALSQMLPDVQLQPGAASPQELQRLVDAMPALDGKTPQQVIDYMQATGLMSIVDKLVPVHATNWLDEKLAGTQGVTRMPPLSPDLFKMQGFQSPQGLAAMAAVNGLGRRPISASDGVAPAGLLNNWASGYIAPPSRQSSPSSWSAPYTGAGIPPIPTAATGLTVPSSSSSGRSTASDWASPYIAANPPAAPAPSSNTDFGASWYNGPANAASWNSLVPKAPPPMPSTPAQLPSNVRPANGMPGADLTSLGVAPSVNVPKYVTISKQVQIPASQPISVGDGVHWDDNLAQYVLDAPAPKAAPTYKTVQQQVINPKWTAAQNAAPKPVPHVPVPVMPLSPDPAELAALRAQQMNPLQRWLGGTPLGHIAGFGDTLANGGLHYGAPAQGGLLGGLFGMLAPRPPTLAAQLQQSQGLSPSAAYNLAGAAAIAQAANPGLHTAYGDITGNSGFSNQSQYGASQVRYVG